MSRLLAFFLCIDLHTVTHVTDLFVFYSDGVWNAVHTGVLSFLNRLRIMNILITIQLSVGSFIKGASYSIEHMPYRSLFCNIFISYSRTFKNKLSIKHSCKPVFLDSSYIRMVNSETWTYWVAGYVLFSCF